MPKNQYFSNIRKGIAHRIGSLSIANSLLAELEQSSYTGIKAYDLHDWEKGKKSKTSFLDIVTNDYNQKIAGWIELLNQEKDAFELQPATKINISPKLNINAAVIKEWKQEEPTIEINIGLILAVEDLLGKCLCTKSFFTQRTPTGELSIANPFFLIGPDHADRFLNYGSIVALGDAHAQLLTAGIPIAPWRLFQFDLIAELSAQWAMLHEQAHWMLGHIDYLAAQRGDTSDFSLNENGENTPLDDATATKYFEMGADALASSLLFHLNWDTERQENKRFRDYRNKLQQAYGNIGSESIIYLNDHAAILRTILLSIGLVVLLMENKRLYLNSPRSSYPLPVTRLLGIFLTVGEAYGDMINFSEDNTYDTEKIRPVIISYIEVIVDLQLIVSLLKINNPIFKPFIWERNKEEEDQFTDDLFSILANGASDPGIVQTEAAKEFIYLRSLDPAFMPRLKNYLHLGKSWLDNY
ncbi:hypothetical protein D3H65_17070 [Paraflavitalea soli]|uniref:Uncharacterized protein n=1 Tax=Paraflavitalea soli TaxID=2315862 RepID=A0A3B7MM41_9BACT|nr:hypothetical protein [Paraflavitalea soli]AXY75584.1 hypothetical protein D3H65_17070 [Paraflavitalea soli]